MGYMLFNERMLETYLHAKKWLKPGGEFRSRVVQQTAALVSLGTHWFGSFEDYRLRNLHREQTHLTLQRKDKSTCLDTEPSNGSLVCPPPHSVIYLNVWVYTLFQARCSPHRETCMSHHSRMMHYTWSSSQKPTFGESLCSVWLQPVMLLCSPTFSRLKILLMWLYFILHRLV